MATSIEYGCVCGCGCEIVGWRTGKTVVRVGCASGTGVVAGQTSGAFGGDVEGSGETGSADGVGAKAQLWVAERVGEG